PGPQMCPPVWNRPGIVGVPVVTRSPIRPEGTGGKAPVSIVVVVQCKTDLLHMVLALRAAGCFSGVLHRRKKQRYQDRDDGNHHQKLNQRESGSSRFPEYFGIQTLPPVGIHQHRENNGTIHVIAPWTSS